MSGRSNSKSGNNILDTQGWRRLLFWGRDRTAELKKHRVYPICVCIFLVCAGGNLSVFQKIEAKNTGVLTHGQTWRSIEDSAIDGYIQSPTGDAIHDFIAPLSRQNRLRGLDGKITIPFISTDHDLQNILGVRCEHCSFGMLRRLFPESFYNVWSHFKPHLCTYQGGDASIVDYADVRGDRLANFNMDATWHFNPNPWAIPLVFIKPKLSNGSISSLFGRTP